MKQPAQISQQINDSQDLSPGDGTSYPKSQLRSKGREHLTVPLHSSYDDKKNSVYESSSNTESKQLKYHGRYWGSHAEPQNFSEC